MQMQTPTWGTVSATSSRAGGIVDIPLSVLSTTSDLTMRDCLIVTIKIVNVCSLNTI